jgi:hypothetical protein
MTEENQQDFSSLNWLREQVESEIVSEVTERRKARNRRKAAKRKARLAKPTKSKDVKEQAQMIANALRGMLGVPETSANVVAKKRPTNPARLVVNYLPFNEDKPDDYLTNKKRGVKEFLGLRVHYKCVSTAEELLR